MRREPCLKAGAIAPRQVPLNYVKASRFDDGPALMSGQLAVATTQRNPEACEWTADQFAGSALV